MPVKILLNRTKYPPCLLYNQFLSTQKKKRPFPFNIPAIQFAKNITLNNITIFVGDNGSGKSSLLEAIAYKINLPLIGGFIKANNRTGFEAAEVLQLYLEIEWKRNSSKGFFFQGRRFQ